MMLPEGKTGKILLSNNMEIVEVCKQIEKAADLLRASENGTNPLLVIKAEVTLLRLLNDMQISTS